MLFDADAAGIKASMRSIELLLKKDIEVKIATLPAGEDPDSYVNKYGKDDFDEQIKKAENFLEYQSEYFEKKGLFSDPAEMTNAIRELVKSAALINDELKRNILIKTIAKKFSLREILIENELEKILKKERTTTKISRPANNQNATSEILHIPPDINISDSEFSTEKEIIKLLFEGNKDIIELIIHYVDPDSFGLSYNRELFSLVADTFDEGEDVIAGALLDKLDDEKARSYLREITFEKYGISKIWEDIYPGVDEKQVLIKYAKDTLIKFKLQQIDKAINENHRKLEETIEEDAKLAIMKKKVELEKDKLAVIKELSSEEVI